MKAILRVLRERTRHARSTSSSPPTARDFYLLQCRPQSYSDDATPAPIPRDLPEDRILFSANRYVSNGRVPDITHIVYVDPERYADLGSLSRAARRRPRGRPPEQAPAEAPVHPDGAGPLGQPGRHQAGRERHLLRHQQHRDAHRGRPQEGQLRARPVVRHALLPGPGRVVHPLPAALSPTTTARCSTRRSCASSPNILPDLLPDYAPPAGRAARHRRAERRPAAWCCAC